MPPSSRCGLQLVCPLAVGQAHGNLGDLRGDTALGCASRLLGGRYNMLCYRRERAWSRPASHMGNVTGIHWWGALFSTRSRRKPATAGHVLGSGPAGCHPHTGRTPWRAATEHRSGGRVTTLSKAEGGTRCHSWRRAAARSRAPVPAARGVLGAPRPAAFSSGACASRAPPAHLAGAGGTIHVAAAPAAARRAWARAPRHQRGAPGQGSKGGAPSLPLPCPALPTHLDYETRTSRPPDAAGETGRFPPLRMLQTRDNCCHAARHRDSHCGTVSPS